jgi:F-type H+-transporting ATPase subunit a
LLLASTNPIEHVVDKPWVGWQVHLMGVEITLMSSCIAAMLLVAAILLAVLVPVGRRRAGVPSGLHNVLESIAVFVRDMIARPALHDKAYDFLPYLLTLFVFVLGMNLFGIIPIEPITHWLGEYTGFLAGKPIGGTATVVPTVCAGLALTTLGAIMACGLWRAARSKHEHAKWPLWVCVVSSPLLWFVSLSPQIPGPVGKVLLIPLALLELLGAVAKCFALMIRLTANIMAGHMLLAVLMMFTLQMAAKALEANALFFGVSILCVLASAAATILDLLVAGLQAYIFTFLTAMFLGLYVEPSH